MPWTPPADAIAWNPPADALSAAEATPDEVISHLEPHRAKGFREVARILSRSPALGVGEHAAAYRVAPEDREAVAAMAAKQYAEDQSMKKLGYGGRLATSLIQGAVDTYMPIEKMLGLIPKLDPDQERYKQRLLGIRQGLDPTIRPDTNILGRSFQQATQMAYPMVNSVTAGKLTGGAGELLGLGKYAATLPLAGKITGVDVATSIGTSGAFLPQTADSTYTSLIGEGVDPTTAWRITAVSAPIEAAIESILPDPFTGYGGAFKGTARQVAGKLLKQYTVNFTKELTEEGLQKVVNETAMEVGRRMDADIPDKGLGNILLSGLQEMRDTALPLAMMVAPGAAVEGVGVAQESAARPKRLALLKELRAAKPFISAEDAQTAGIPGETRKERLSNTDSEIKQLEQEIQDASTVRSPEAEVRQPESGQNLRRQGQEQVPAQPAGEVASEGPQVLDPHQAILEALQAAEEAAPAAPKPSSPEEMFGLPGGPTGSRTFKGKTEWLNPDGSVWKPEKSAAAVMSGKDILQAQVQASGKPQEEVLARGPAEFVPSEKPKPAEQPKKSMGRKPESLPAPKGESIVAAALRSPDGKIYTGAWHPDAAEAMQKDLGVTKDEIYSLLDAGKVSDGFITSKGRFVGRDEANKMPPGDNYGERLNLLQPGKGGRQFAPAAPQEAEKPVKRAEAEPDEFTETTDKPVKRRGRKDQAVTVQPEKPPEPAAIQAPEAFIQRKVAVAAENGDVYVVPSTNQAKREATKQALGEAGLEPVPEKLNYWRPAKQTEAPPETTEKLLTYAEFQATNAAKSAAEKGGEVYVDTSTNQATREETKQAFREAGLEPVPGKLNYWRPAKQAETTTEPDETDVVNALRSLTRGKKAEPDELKMLVEQGYAVQEGKKHRPTSSGWKFLKDVDLRDQQERQKEVQAADERHRATLRKQPEAQSVQPKEPEAKAEPKKVKATVLTEGQRQAIERHSEPGKSTVYRNKKGEILLATEHKNGLWRTIVNKDGTTDAQFSGPVDENVWTPFTQEPATKAELPAKPAEEKKAVEPFTRRTPPEGSSIREEQQQESQLARDRELALRERKKPLESQLKNTRRNAYKKRGEIQSQMNALDKQIGEQQQIQQRHGKKLSEASIEDFLEKPGLSETHREAGLADLARHREQWDEANRHEHNVQAEFTQAAQEHSDKLNKDEIAAVADRARRDFSVSSRSTPAQIVEATVQQQLSARPTVLRSDARNNLPAEQLKEFDARMAEAAKGKDFYEKQAAITDEALAAGKVAAEVYRKEREIKAEADRKEAEVQAVEQMKANRQRAKSVGREERFWKELSKRANAIKGKKGTAEVVQADKTRVEHKAEILDDKWAITESVGDFGKKAYSLTHIPTGLAAVTSSTSANVKQFVQLARDAGADLNIPDVLPEGWKVPESLKGVREAWDTTSLYSLPEDVKEKLVGKVSVAPTKVKADIVLDSFDLGAHDQKLDAHGLAMVKEMTKDVPEFAYEPVFTVNAKKQLVFRDGATYTLNPEQFNLHPSELTEGQTVGINLEDIGLKQISASETVARSLKNAGFSNVRETESGVTASWGGKKVQLTGKDDKWTVHGSEILPIKVAGQSQLAPSPVNAAVQVLAKMHFLEGKPGFQKTEIEQAADKATQEQPAIYGSVFLPPGTEADLSDAASGIMKVAGELRRWLSPAGVSDASKLMAGNIREHAAELSLRHEQAATALGKFSKAVGKLSQQQKYDFIDGIETGGQQATPELDHAAGLMRTLLDEARDRVRALGKGQLDNFIDNYFPHIWKDPAKAQTAFGKRPLEGSKAFLKQRTIPTTKDGLALGLEPVTDNPIDLTLLKLREINRYEMSQKILAEGKDQGYVKLFKSPNQVPDGWVKINDKIAEVWERRATATGAPEFIHRGRYYAQQDAGRVLNNYLSPGLAGNPVYDAWRYSGNLLNMSQLGLSAFHLTFTAMDAVISQNALAVKHLSEGSPVRAAKAFLASPGAPITTFFQGSKLLKEAWSGARGELADIVDALQAGGWRTRQDSFYRLGDKPTSAWQSFLLALKEGRPSAVPKGFAALLEQSSRPIMDYLVPRMKAGVALNLAKYELQKMQDSGAVPSRNELRQIMARAWDSVDNRMGQMVYDNLFWNKVLKDLSMASVRSVGWNLGTFRELGGGTADFAGMLNQMRQGNRPELSHRAAYVISLPFTVGLVGAILGYLFRGEPPDELLDLYAIPTGEVGPDGNEERVMLASYMKDVIGFATHPLKTLSHKAHPAISLVSDMLQNRDFYGNQIRNEQDPVVEQAKQASKHLAEEFVPFSVRNAAYEKSRGQSLGKQAQSFFGVVPANRELVRTPAQNMAANFLRTTHGGHGSMTPDQVETQQLRNTLVSDIRSGMSVEEAVAKAEESGKLTSKQIGLSLKKAKKDPAILMFQPLTDDELEDVLKVSSDEEKTVIRKILFDRFARSDTTPPRAKDYIGRKADFELAQKEFSESIAANKKRLSMVGGSLEEARAMLKEYYLRPDSKGKRGSLREKDTGNVKESYLKKQRALAKLFLE